MKFKEFADDLVSRASIQIIALLGLIFCWMPIGFVDIFTLEIIPGMIEIILYSIVFVFLPSCIVFPIFFGIESLFKIRIKFSFLKNKYIKQAILPFATLFLIIMIASLIFIYYTYRVMLDL